MIILVKEKDVQTVSIEGRGHVNKHISFSLPLAEFLIIHSPSRHPRAAENLEKWAEFIQIFIRALSKTLETWKNMLDVQKYKLCKMQVSTKK